MKTLLAMGRSYRSKLSYYTDTEEEVMEVTSLLRRKLFRPFIHLFDRIGLEPLGLSILGLFCMACCAIVALVNPVFSLIFLVLYLLFDGFDGPLARYQNKDDVSGVFVDLVVDHAALVIFLIAILLLNLAHPALIYGYAILYIFMMMFGIMMRAQSITIKGNVRSKSIVYVIFAIWAFWHINLFTLFFWLTIPLMFIIDIFRFNMLVKHLRGKRW